MAVPNEVPCLCCRVLVGSLSCSCNCLNEVCSCLCIRALGNAMPNFKSFAEGCSAASRIFALIRRVPPIDADDTTRETLDKVTGDLELRNVDFSYPSRRDVPIFQNFSLQIPAGECWFLNFRVM